MANRKHIGLEVLDTLVLPPPPLPPPPPSPTYEWTTRTSWPFDEGIRPRALYGVWLPSRTRFVVVGYAANVSTILPEGVFVAVSDNDGVTWSSRSTPSPWDSVEYPGNLAIGYSSSQDRIIITGDVNSGGTATHSIYSDDGGETWTYNPLVITGTFPTWYQFPAYIGAVKWIEEQSQWLIGGANISTSPTGIDSFTKRLFVNDGGVGVSFAYSPIDDRLAVVRGNKIYTSDDAGATWTEQSTPFDGGQIAFVEWCPSISQFMAGANNSDSTRSVIFSSDGITWAASSAISNDPGYPQGEDTSHVWQVFGAVDDGPEIFAAQQGFSSDQNIKKSLDGGSSWVISPNPNNGNVELSFVKGQDVVLALGADVPIMTHQIPGATPPGGPWFTRSTPINETDAGGYVPVPVCFVPGAGSGPNGRILAIGVDLTLTAYRVIYSDDDGVTWASFGNPFGSDDFYLGNIVYCNSLDKVVLSGWLRFDDSSNKNIIVSDDAGETWGTPQNVNDGYPDGTAITTLHWSETEGILLAGGYATSDPSSGAITFSTTNLTSWTPHSIGDLVSPGGTVYTIRRVDALSKWFVSGAGPSGNVLYSSTDLSSWTHLSTPVDGEGTIFGTFYRASSGRLYIASSPGGPSGVIFYSEDSGSTWTHEVSDFDGPADYTSACYGFAETGDGILLAIGADTFPITKSLLRRNDTDDTWVVESTPNDPGGQTYSITYISASNIVVIGVYAPDTTAFSIITGLPAP